VKWWNHLKLLQSTKLKCINYQFFFPMIPHSFFFSLPCTQMLNIYHIYFRDEVHKNSIYSFCTLQSIAKFSIFLLFFSCIAWYIYIENSLSICDNLNICTQKYVLIKLLGSVIIAFRTASKNYHMGFKNI
jgi:hypothetical protein